MSNDYFNLTTVVTRLTAAKASAINAMAAAITAAFDKIPAQAALATDRVTYAADTGTANAKQMSLPLVTSYLEGLTVRFKVGQTNTGATTLQINALGARAIRRPSGTDLNAGDLLAGSIHEVSYNGTNFELLTAVLSDVQEAQSAATFAQNAATQAGVAASNAAASASDAVEAANNAAGAVNSAIGVTVQAYSEDLTQIAGLTWGSNKVPIWQSGGWENFTITNWARTLLLAFDVTAARNTLGLGAVAQDSIVPVSRGGTGGTTQATARAGIGAQAELGYTPVQQGGGTSMGANKVYVGWDSGNGAMRLQVDSTALGFVARGAASGTVMGEIAATALGGIGTLAWLERDGTTADIVPGGTYAGTTLRWSGALVDSAGTGIQSPGISSVVGFGTWRALGAAAGASGTYRAATLFVRVS